MFHTLRMFAFRKGHASRRRPIHRKCDLESLERRVLLSSIVDLGTLGGSVSSAYGINDSGQVVGYTSTAGDTAYHAFLYSGGVMSDLGTLGGSGSSAYGINDSGQVVGYASTAGVTVYHAFLYSGGVMSDLGTLGGSFSEAVGINDSGQVVGLADTAGNAAGHAFLYSGGVMSDLNSLLPSNSGWTLEYATAINNEGQIVGIGSHNGATHAFLLNLSALTFKVDSSNVVPATASPEVSPPDDLHLNQVFGTENVAVPLTIENQGQSEAKGDGTISLYLSTTQDLSGEQARLTPVKAQTGTIDGQSVQESIDLQPSDKLSDTIFVQIPESSSLEPGKKYYIVAQLVDPSLGTSKSVSATDNAFEFVGSPTANSEPFTNGAYFQFISDTLNSNYVVSQQTMSNAKSFIGHFEGDYLFPYLDPAGIPMIGVGINLNSISGTLMQDLVEDVRSYYNAHYPKVTLPKSASGVIALLSSQAVTNGYAPFGKPLPKPVISTDDDQDLFDEAFQQHEKNVILAVGQDVWENLNEPQRTALVDIDYNVKGGLAKTFPTLVKDVKNDDYVKAGFDLVNAKRTTQLPGLTKRTEADYQALLFDYTDDLTY